MKNIVTETYDKEHLHFGGLVYPSDFNTDYRGNDQEYSSIANRIYYDQLREKKLLKLMGKKKSNNKQEEVR